MPLISCVQHEIKYGIKVDINSFSSRWFTCINPCMNHEIKCYINSIWTAVWPAGFYGCTELYGNWYELPYLSSYKSTDARCVLQKQVRVLPTNASTYRVASLAIKEKVCVTEYKLITLQRFKLCHSTRPPSSSWRTVDHATVICMSSWWKVDSWTPRLSTPSSSSPRYVTDSISIIITISLSSVLQGSTSTCCFHPGSTITLLL